MNAYRWGINLKLGLILAAMAIAVGSLWYTNRLANRLQQGESEVVELYARAIEYMYKSDLASGNPHRGDLLSLRRLLDRVDNGEDPRVVFDTSRIDMGAFRDALAWSMQMPPADQTNFVFDEIISTRRFDVPAITTDVDYTEVSAYNNVEIPRLPTRADSNAYLLQRAREMQNFDPIPVRLDFGEGRGLSQLVHYDESKTIGHLRIMPYVQLLFVGLFILVGYLGFSYVRKSEQHHLWVGMAKEAAHQLGTPISGMMGWTAMLETADSPEVQSIGAEISRDIGRLQRVASRFSKIGSRPSLKSTALREVIAEVVEYMQRRMPSSEDSVRLAFEVEEGLEADINVELFEWVLENLIKNALDAIERGKGSILIKAYSASSKVRIDVIDDGRGIEKRQSRNIFRPGYSTKKRGWGLGLSLAKRIVEDYHGGRLELAHSTPGSGSTFRVAL